jgi:hypothetical protein
MLAWGRTRLAEDFAALPTRQTSDCEIIAFKTSLAISNREGLTSGKSAFGANFVIWE